MACQSLARGSQSTESLGRTVGANEQAPRATRQLDAHVLHDRRHSRQRPPIYPAVYKRVITQLQSSKEHMLSHCHVSAVGQLLVYQGACVLCCARDNCGPGTC